MKTLLLGIALIILVGIGGLVYRNAVSRPDAPAGACTLDARVCPDGSAVGRVAPSCDFAACPPPNVALAGVVFALPEGFASTTLPDANAVAAYASASSSAGEIDVRQYPLGSSTPESVIYASAIGDASGALVSPGSFSAATLGTRTYSFVVLGRFEGVVHAAYYLPVGDSVLRFDSIDRGVAGWSDPALDVAALPANAALRAMLSTLQTNQ